MIAYLGIAFIILSILFLLIFFIKKSTKQDTNNKITQHNQICEPQIQINYGRLRIYYGSQTGTAAKLAEQLAQQFKEHHFQAQVIDLKNVQFNHFSSINQISIFLLSNTGQGDPPQNTVRWMKILKGREDIQQDKKIDWKQVHYTVFGLGNTQYQHFNKTGIDADKLLQQRGANRIYKLGLGDDNCSLQDDYTLWKKDLWPTLKQFRTKNPLIDNYKIKNQRKISSQGINTDTNFISNSDPIYANFKLFYTNTQQNYIVNEEQLDFKTKNSLKASLCKVVNRRQLRQNVEDGSTIQLQIQLQQPQEYQTAGNIAIYGKNDPKIIKNVIDYFKINEKDLNKVIDLKIINEDKRLKINFIPRTLRKLLEESIDLQGKLTKSVLKKLSKIQSINPNYFIENSSKTTEQYKRITQDNKGDWYYLIKIIQEHKVKICFEDFIQLSDSMAPRLFTMASYHKTQQNVVIAASITENGLFSKFILTEPLSFKTQLKKSTFTDAMKWKKVIFMSAGTGLAPFRAYLQEKQYLKNTNKQLRLPIITLFFGCKHENGDFIYKDEIMAWKDKQIINRLHLAFSRDQQNKVYVQDLLKKEQAELSQFGHCQQTALYFCGSFPMGQSIIQVLKQAFGAQKVKQMQQKGRIIKQLW